MIDVMNKFILMTLNSFIIHGKTVQCNNLICSLKVMLSSTTELKLEDKLIKLCNIVDS
jgi:hypothetical protein